MATKHPTGPVLRWVDHAPGQQQEIDAQLGEMFRALQDEGPLSPAELSSVGRRLTQGKPQKRGRRAGIRHFVLVLAVLAGGGSVALAEWKRPGFWSLRSFFSARSLTPAQAGRIGAKKAPLTTAAPEREHKLGEAVKAEPEPMPQSPLAASVPKPAAASAAARPSPLALESELLQKALVKLRRDHDARAALAALDDYQAEFPRGALGLEASVARVDALLLLGQRHNALELLARLPLERVGRRAELRLLRAELYAESDCRKAILDFDALLATGSNERALYGRAGCRLRLGDVAGGRADLQSYLQSYPSGRFAEQVRARLASR